MAAQYPGNASPSMPIPTPGAGVYLNNPSLTGVLTTIRDEVAAVTGTLGASPQTTYATVKDRLAAMDTAIAGAGGGGGASTIQLSVTADGTTDAAPAIQTVLDALATSTHSLHVIVDGATKGGSIYLNSKVRITTSNTKVSFAAPVIIGTTIDPDGSGGLSILGSLGTATTISAGATRGSSKVTVASLTGMAVKTLVKVSDNVAVNSSTHEINYRTELAEIVDIDSTAKILYLDHPLHHTYASTISVAPVNAVTNSGFDGVSATFTGKQTATFLFPAKMEYTRLCYFKNMHFRGDPNNSWSRECVNVRNSYRCLVDNSSVNFGWDYTVGTTFDYGFSADMVTSCIWRSCQVSNTRHGFSADKGSAGLIYSGCISENATASGFDLHGSWVRDITYADCMASGSDTRNAADTTQTGFLAGNTSYLDGAQWITYVGCTARAYGPYTTASSTAGEGAGFGVVDGSSDITMMGCRMVDCMNGLTVLSQNGAPIKNVSVIGCEFNGVSGGGAPLPFWINAAATAPDGINGVFIKNSTFTNCTNMASGRIYGSSGNQLTNVVVDGNTWIGPGVSGVFAIDIQYVDDPLVVNNTFYKTRRGVTFKACTSPSVVNNTFFKLADGSSASNIVLDNGGANPNLLVANNSIVGFVPTGAGTAPSSTGASATFTPAQARYATASRPAAAAVGAGSSYYDTTLGKPGWSTGAAWKDAAGTTI